MSQNDFNIANQGFPSFRSDLNGALQALASNSAGTSAPATTYAYMWWYDSTNNVLKMRNADNDAWISFASFNQATDSWSFSTVDINGGTIDGATIGGTTPAAVTGTNVTATGRVRAAGGSAAAPSITKTGDENTGFYFPAADTVAVVVAGVEVGRFDSSSNLLVGKTATNYNNTGVQLFNAGYVHATADGANVVTLNRKTSDGNLVELRQDGTQQGSISVSGTTVSYNGGHLSRWSRLPDGTDETNIFKGTVMTNLNEKIVWDGEENEQLNYTTVSSVEGDVNVAGIFVAWDESDEWGDYYLAQTGDLIIRVAAGVAVNRGDLLMSAGNGTAKPQGDDIVRSKTIAKVISTEVTCTYADGSYCVPCVLMAC